MALAVSTSPASDLKFPEGKEINPMDLIRVLLEATREDLLGFLNDDESSQTIEKIATEFPEDVFLGIPDLKRKGMMKELREDYSERLSQISMVAHALIVKCIFGDKKGEDFEDLRSKITSVARINATYVRQSLLLFKNSHNDLMDMMITFVDYSLSRRATFLIATASRQPWFNWNQCKAGLFKLNESNAFIDKNIKGLLDRMKNGLDDSLDAKSSDNTVIEAKDPISMDYSSIITELSDNYAHMTPLRRAELLDVAFKMKSEKHVGHSRHSIYSALVSGIGHGDAVTFSALSKMLKNKNVFGDLFRKNRFSTGIVMHLSAYNRFLELDSNKFLIEFKKAMSVLKVQQKYVPLKVVESIVKRIS